MEVSMKKILILILIPFLVFLIGCDTEEENPNDIVLTYSNWNLGTEESKDTNMERLMIEAFMEKYPHITVKIIERPTIPGTTDDMNWNDFLASRASTQTLPDVFMADNIPLYVINNWAYNLTDIANKDPEFLNVSVDIRGSSTYEGKVMAIPCAVFYAGYVINKTLYDNANEDYPTVTSTFDELITATRNVAKHSSTTNDGVVGLDGIEHIIHWYPAQLNEDFGWFTLTDEGFNLDSNEFVETMNFYRQLQTDETFVYDALLLKAAEEDSPINLETIFPEGDQFNNGNVAAKWFYSWDFGYFQTKLDDGEFIWDLDFIGTPVVNGNKRVPSVADFFAVASNTKHPEEAYLLAKWMGFGKEGYAKRLELSKTVQGISKVNFPPLQSDDDLLDGYFELYPSFLGLRTIIENGKVLIEPPKYLPGYNDARYQGTYDADNRMFDIIEKLRFGEVQIADIATKLNQQANAIYQEARSAFDAAIEKR
jgi:multiple sugar transport system substrate-binding protein